MHFWTTFAARQLHLWYAMLKLTRVLVVGLVAAGCHDKPAGGPGAAADGGVDAPPKEYAPEPVGFGLLSHFERLPYLQRGVRALGTSSADPAGGNDDQSHYVGQLPNGEAVLFDEVGPGVIYRFWSTRDINDHGGTYRFYFDGATAPQLTIGREQMWGAQDPFRAPLTLGRAATSGGYVTFFPIAFAKSLVITETGQRAPDYYNINWARISNGTPVATFSGHEDGATVADTWAHPGRNPSAPDPGDVTETGPFIVAPGESVQLSAIAGARMITALKITNLATDDGRAFLGSSDFTVAIDPGNDGVTLTRRLDYSVANQSATVLVDGQEVGMWSDPGSDKVRQWRNSRFVIPGAFTAGKSSIHVAIRFASSEIDWNEFHYWVDSRVAGEPQRTDELDVGNAASEQHHGYTVTQPTFAGSRTFRYPGAHRGRLRVFWDGQGQAAIDSPVAELFGTTAALNSPVRALPLGNDDGDFYLYFPMPFATSARIVLTAPGGEALQGSYVVTHRPFNDDFTRVGYFHAQYRSVDHTTAGKDYVVLDAEGSGQYVGMNLVVPERGYTLEGDERIFVDGARSAAIHGTGTEDYFNAGWYYEGGSFTTPSHGAPFVPTGAGVAFSQYRFHLGDLVPFSAAIKVSIEHAAVDDSTAPYASVAYFYLSPNVHLVKSDEVAIGDASSEAAHALVDEGAMPDAQLTSRFMSDDGAQIMATSRAVTGSTTFTAAIERANTGMVLRRWFDHKDPGQTAEVWVDGQLAGTWRTASGNGALRWREEDFDVPETFTKGRSSVTIKLVVKSAVWNASRYQVFSATL